MNEKKKYICFLLTILLILQWKLIQAFLINNYINVKVFKNCNERESTGQILTQLNIAHWDNGIITFYPSSYVKITRKESTLKGLATQSGKRER